MELLVNGGGSSPLQAIAEMGRGCERYGPCVLPETVSDEAGRRFGQTRLYLQRTSSWMLLGEGNLPGAVPRPAILI